MADVKISALPLASTPLAGTEVLPIVQSATTDQVSVANLTAGRSVSAASLTLTTTPLAVGSGGTGLTSLTAGYIPYASSSSTLSFSSNLYSDGTKIGIGTSSPVSNFQVNAASTEIASSLSIAGTRYFQFYSDGSTLATINAYQGLPLVFSVAASGSSFAERMRIASNGSVGIGTTSPSFKLDVSGAAGNGIRYTGNSVSMVMGETGGFGLLGTTTNQNVGLYTNATLRATLDTSGNLGLGVTPSAWGSAWTALQIRSGGTSIWTDGGFRSFYSTNVYFDGANRRYVGTGEAFEYSQAGGGGHSWSYAASGTAGTVLTLTTGMTLNTSGNLGIGVSPSYKLDVAGTTRLGSGGSAILASVGAAFVAGQGELYTLSTNSFGLGTSGSAPINFYTNSTLAARIDASGNIIYQKLIATGAAAPTIASATTIAPTTPIVFISGTTAIATITAPSPISSGGGQITLIPTGVFTTTTAGNIALASTAVVSRALIMTYDTTTAKWYPSY